MAINFIGFMICLDLQLFIYGLNTKEENLRVTYIPRQTGIAQTFDINPDILKDFHFYSDGYYEIPYREDLVFDERQIKTTPGAASPAASPSNAIARFEKLIPLPLALSRDFDRSTAASLGGRHMY